MTIIERNRADVRNDNLAEIWATGWWLRSRERTVWQRLARRMRKRRF